MVFCSEPDGRDSRFYGWFHWSNVCHRYHHGFEIGDRLPLWKDYIGGEHALLALVRRIIAGVF